MKCFLQVNELNKVNVYFILNIENNVPIHINDAEGSITCLSWISCPNEHEILVNESKDSIETSIKSHLETNEVWAFLTQLPSLSKAYSYNPSGEEDTEDCQKLLHGHSMSLLIAGTKKGHISLYMNGFLHCTKVDMNGIEGSNING